MGPILSMPSSCSPTQSDPHSPSALLLSADIPFTSRSSPQPPSLSPSTRSFAFRIVAGVRAEAVRSRRREARQRCDLARLQGRSVRVQWAHLSLPCQRSKCRERILLDCWAGACAVWQNTMTRRRALQIADSIVQ